MNPGFLVGATLAVALALPARAGPLRVRAHAVPARSETLRPAPELDAYVAARAALARGEPAGVLKSLASTEADLLADRVALTRADAHLALGQLKKAEVAYTLAFESARVTEVSEAALRGLFEVFRQASETERAEAAVEGLLAHRKSRSLQLARIRLLESRGAKKAAHEAALELARSFPWTSDGKAAARIAAKLERSGVAARPIPRSERLERAEAMLDAGQPSHARTHLDLAPPGPRRRWLEARLAAATGHPDVARAGYLELTGKSVPSSIAAEALWTLGRAALRADDNPAALAHFDALNARAPGHALARKAKYLAGWIAYDAGRYDEARERMLAYVQAHPRARDKDEALWYAGWASYLGKTWKPAHAIFTRLAHEHAGGALAVQAQYWLGRIAGHLEDAKGARAHFQRARSLDPLGYYGLWAAHRLGELGAPIDELEPPASAPFELEAALARLGPNRPDSVDRAVHLHRIGREGEAAEELAAAAPQLKAHSRRARLELSRLQHALGAHYLAFRGSVGLLSGASDLAKGDQEAFTVWRGAYPRAFESAVDQAGATHGVPAEMVWAVMRTESHYRPWVRSPVGARGLMQLMPATAREIGRVATGARRHARNYQSAESNIWLGSWYLSDLLERYGGQIVPAVGAYNGGPAAMDRWLEAFDGMALDEFVERIPYRETRRYVRRVVETWSIYQQIYRGVRPPLPERIQRVVKAETASF